MSFTLYGPNDNKLSLSKFKELVSVIRARMEKKTGAPSEFTDEWADKFYSIYAQHGLISALEVDGNPICVMLNYDFNDVLYYNSGGYLESYASYSPSKSLMYLTFKHFHDKTGTLNLHLGGGDFGIKQNFGAKETPMYNSVVKRPDSDYEKLYDNFDIRSSLVVLGRGTANTLPTSGILKPLTYNKDTDSSLYLNKWFRSVPPLDAALEIIAHKSIEFAGKNGRCLVACSASGQSIFKIRELGFSNIHYIAPTQNAINDIEKKLGSRNISGKSILMGCQEDLTNLPSYKLVYLYNTFNSKDDLSFFASSLMKYGIDFYIAYINDKFGDTLLDLGFVKKYEFTPRSDEWRFTDTAAIYYFPGVR